MKKKCLYFLVLSLGVIGYTVSSRLDGNEREAVNMLSSLMISILIIGLLKASRDAFCPVQNQVSNSRTMFINTISSTFSHTLPFLAEEDEKSDLESNLSS